MKNYLSSFIVTIIITFSGLSLLTEAQVFIKDGKLVSYELVIKFKKQVVNISTGEKYASVNNITEQGIEFKNYLNQFGETIVLEKMIPHAKPNDTVWTNSKGEIKKLNDWSQVFIIKFEELKDIENEVDKIRRISNIEYVEPRVQIKDDEIPNDLHLSGNQWYLTKIQAANAWDISKGNSNIRIAIIEGNGVANHNDVNNKFVVGETGSTSDHGIKVAGVVGAETDNAIGIASLGWNISLVRMNGSNGTGIESDIRNAADPSLLHKADIINCSFKTIWRNQNGTYYSYNYSSLQDAVEDAQAFGAIVIASAGNPPNTADGDLDVVPFTQWPAAYTGVIGVSATNSSDQFPSGYNYGFHVDVSAPSVDILTTGLNNSYVTASGTSFGSPLVAALAGLILSVNNNLTNSQVASLIQTSSDDLGTVGRDDYYGYGRINALRALANAYILSNPQYTYTENYAPITLYQQNIWRDFDCVPAPGIPPGRYYIDIYKIEDTTNNYVDIFNGWFLGLPGYYPGTPINCQPYLYKNVENDQLTLRTFYYFIKKKFGGGSVNVWAPLDPTSNSTRKYSVLGEPLVAPLISNFTQNPVPICKGSIGYVQVNLSQGNGNLTYNWISENQPSYISIDPQG